MQEASAAFATAIAKSVVLWSRPLLLADWLSDGYTQLASLTNKRPGYIVDRFRRSSDSTWTRPDIGLPGYTHTGGSNSDYTVVNGSHARHGHGAVNTTRTTIIQTGSSDMRVEGRWTASATITGTGETVIDLLARDDGSGTLNHYAARMEIDPADNTIDIKIVERIAGTGTAIATTNNALIWSPTHQYAFIIQPFDDEGVIRAKFWDENISIEPVDWTLEATTTVITGGAYAGLRTTVPSTMTNSLPFYIQLKKLVVHDGSIDDLSDLHGQVTVTQTLDDGLPDDVSFVQDLGTALLSAQVIGGWRGLRASQYLSAFNLNSPLYGLDRDIAPVKYEHGVITASGAERVRLFTGQMVDLPIGKDHIGHLEAMSSTRLKLSRLIQPPPFNLAGDLSATWAVSWAAYVCGVYAAPNPSAGGMAYYPLHGSLQPFKAFGMPESAPHRGIFPVFQASHLIDTGTGAFTFTAFGTDAEALTPPYIAGPYVAAPDLKFTATKAVGVYLNNVVSDFADDGTTDYLSQTGPRGRFEFAVRGDTFAATGPSGANLTPATFILGLLLDSSSTGTKVFCGINMSRQLRIEMSDGTASINANAAAAFDLPSDGQWYKYGVAWDFVTETAYFYRRDPDGTEHEATSTNAALDVTRLPVDQDDFATVQPFGSVITTFNTVPTTSPWFHSFLPCAELHLSGGTLANPTTGPWIWSDDYGFTASAVIGVSSHRFRAIAEPVEREAWEYIGAFAQAEMAVTRVDELDRMMYLPVQYWAQEAQQTTADDLSTLTNVSDMVPQRDPSKIRNAIRVSYQDTRIDRLSQPVFASRDLIAIPNGTSTLLIILDDLATGLDQSGATLPTQVQITAGLASFLPTGFFQTFFTFNASADGTGVVYSNGGSPSPLTDLVYAQIDDVFTASLCTVTIINKTGTTIYTANDNVEVPTILIAGQGARKNEASASAIRASSIAKRGYRGLTVESDVIQTSDAAGRLAQRLLSNLAEPVSTLEDVKLFGDQRRQPGDLVTFDDARDTGVDGLWRLLRVNHVVDGASYTQDVRLKAALEVGVWGTSRWGQCIWGREGL